PVSEGPAVLALDLVAVRQGGVPAQCAGSGRARVLGVQPRPEEVQEPTPLRRGGRVEAQDGTTALAAIGGPQPAQHEPHLKLRHLMGLVDADEVMGPAAVVLFVAGVLEPAKLNLSTAGQSPPDTRIGVEGTQRPEDVAGAVGQGAKVFVLLAE